HQGKNVILPEDVTGVRRRAFGRNGIGRHGMLCFCDNYTVSTRKGKKEAIYHISSTSKSQALSVDTPKIRILSMDSHGTTLTATVDRNLPDANKVLEELAKRFIADPSFRVTVNGRTMENSEIMQEAHSEKFTVHVNDVELTIELLLIDTEKAHKKASYQGVAFWQAGRLVGEPSWMVGKHPVLDGRTQIAKRYTFIVRSEDFELYINEDWTAFIISPVMDAVYDEVANRIEKLLGDINLKNIQGIKASVQQEHQEEYKKLSRVGKLEVDDVITHIVTTKPAITNEALSAAVGAVISIEQTRSGVELLQKLTTLDPDEIDTLNRLLDDWSVKDAMCVLDEIDRRLSVIEAIRKLHYDKGTDELHTLHPLITSARWVFGPEFDSPEYSANHQLRTIAKTLFNVDDADFQDGIKRPDLIVKGDSTIGLTTTEEFSENGITYIDKVLLVELKRGGFKITRQERNQAQGYVEQLFDSKTLTSNSRVTAFVVGDSIESDSLRKTIVCEEKGVVYVISYAQLVDSANRRLFRLREILSDRYEKYTGQELANKAIQMQLPF
ncbi:MAG: hypothetical protein J6X55_03435, partial [Victivallales bacterium]|nr:hypothetical protein [Victivallales bacterium]